MSEGQSAEEQYVGPLGLVETLDRPEPPPAPVPDAVWHFGRHLNPEEQGQADYVPVYDATAWVYFSNSRHGLVRPVLLADGFNSGPSKLDELYDGFENGEYPFISELRGRGRDAVIFGFGDRTASILDNAAYMTEAIMKLIAERRGDEPLVVGGFSMGGLVARYALAGMETESIDHQTALYFSYDSPHRGAWVPIGLQAFAHYLKRGNPANGALSDQINSTASRQLLWRHIEAVGDIPGEDKARGDFLAALESVGNWPMRPRKIGVANGRGDGLGTGIEPGGVAFRSTGLLFPGTTLYAQAEGDDALVAELKANFGQDETVTTDGLPAIDGAPGGTLNSFEIAANTLNGLPFGGAEAPVPEICFVPSVSAVDVCDLDTTELLTTDIGSLPPERSALDDFLCASDNERHTKITAELCEWIIERL
ncbi:esterase/lipase family protein [Streptomyces sp. NPDC087850]|uniref:esterase/lipase family protein n=1 Tax=Streptomyces sp. NPDC087850 TaxID=3365809 RepID=UPI00382061B3